MLINAAKYTEPGGRVTVTLERDDGDAVIRVRGTGNGIAPDILPRVFDLFVQGSRADRAPGGLGIGLTLEVKSHGGGSEFVMRLQALPLVGEPRVDLPRASQPPSA